MVQPVFHRLARGLSALACLLGLAIHAAWAGPIPLLETYGTTAFADVDGTSDGPNSAAAPPTPLPLFATADVTTAGGSAEAAASAEPGALAVATRVGSAGGTAQASAVATLLGAFTTPGGPLALEVLDLGGLALGGIALDILWIIDGLTLPTPGPGQFLSGPWPAGRAGTLEITLTSNALAQQQGEQDGAAAAVAFSLRPVPAPGGLALLLPGLGLLALRDRRARQRAAAASASRGQA